jgi:hypothetical protein
LTRSRNHRDHDRHGENRGEKNDEQSTHCLAPLPFASCRLAMGKATAK